MANAFGFIIRDGLETDVESCLMLDSTYETDFVWQMHIQRSSDMQRAAFSTERLPRTMEAVHPVDERRLHFALAPQQCLLVAVGRTEPQALGFLTMTTIRTHGVGIIQDIVVDQPFRRRRIGLRLLNAARQWAAERGLESMMLETRTQNYPATQFCQSAGMTFCGFNDQYFPNRDIAVFFGQSLR